MPTPISGLPATQVIGWASPPVNLTPLVINPSLTGAAANAALSITPTWNTSGNPTVISVSVTETAVGSSPLYANFQSGGTSRVSISRQNASDQNPGAGIVRVSTATGDRTMEFTHYQYGGTIRGSGTNGNILELFLGESGTPQVSLRGLTDGRGALFQARDANDLTGVFLDFSDAAMPRITLEDNASSPNELSIRHPRATGYVTIRTGGGTERFRFTAAGLLAIGGATSSFPALRNTGARMDVRLADNSAYADLFANTITSNNGFNANGNNVEAIGQLIFNPSRCRIASPADGEITLLNNASSGFSLLRFGGTTSSFPALKRNSTALETKLADDSAYAPHAMQYLDVTDGITAPGAGTGRARIYVDTADGDLKVVFADGTVKTIVTDT